jgi:hypothetical protein
MSDPSSDEEIEQIQQEREERLDPDNRPDNAEVDNTDREFDERLGRFTDSEPPEDGEEPGYATAEEDEQAG